MEIKTPEDYLAAQPEEYREKLEELRSIVKKTLPESEELISYQIISYKYIYMLVGIGVKKNYCSFYTMNPNLVKRFEPRLKDIKFSGGTLHFPLDRPLPHDLIRDLIHAREKENLLKAELNRKK
ncbi:MAG: DUF1801 domain-containing protein [Candidatus Marinimicrobia bacterium]|nr:DUF1801 domain-containing protein [Candidatus Neomarinimicrobiota bacterium]